jgi:flagellar motor switch/type III secretory pathway protein FliN
MTPHQDTCLPRLSVLLLSYHLHLWYVSCSIFRCVSFSSRCTQRRQNIIIVISPRSFLMHPRLSREEINALLDKTEEVQINSFYELIIDLGNQRIIFKDILNLNKKSMKNLKFLLNRTYEIKIDNAIIAYGILNIIDKELIKKMSSL